MDLIKRPPLCCIKVSLAGHNKPVLALALDPAGGRILSGGLDFKLKFWDFGGMVRNGAGGGLGTPLK